MGWVLIVNPFASGVDEQRLAAVAAALPAGTAVRATSAPGEATELAREADGAADAIVVYAGDGTYNEVVNGVSGRTPIGFVPGGGTSVLPRALGLPRDPVAAATIIAARRTRRIGLGRVNNRRFTFNAGVGLDAALVRAVDQLGRADDGRRPGDRAFVRAALGVVGRSRGRLDPALTIDGLGRAAFALVANCTPYTYLGRLPLRVAREARFERGLDIVAPIRVTPITVPRLAWQAWRGRGGRGVLTAHDVAQLVVRCDAPQPLQADGEDLGDIVDAVFEAEPDAITVLA